MDLKEIYGIIKDTAVRWFDGLAYGVRTYRGWVLGGAVIVSIFLIVWARFGFTLQFSQYYASSGVDSENCGGIAGEHACCVQSGGDPATVCGDDSYTLNFGETSTCTGGCYGSTDYCGPSVPAGGDFSWSLADSNVPSCGTRPNANTEYVVGVDVGSCHPDGLHLVWRAIHRPTANCSFTDSGGSVEIAEGDGIRTWYTEGSFINLNDWEDDKPGGARMAYDGGAANCGSVHMFGAFWADPPPEAYKHNLAGNKGYHVVLNYGTPCTGAPGQFSPGGTPTGGGGPGTPGGGTLSVTCGEDANILTWDKGTGVQRGNEGTKNLSECADYWCWLPSSGYAHTTGDSGQYEYIDDKIQAGTCYEYRVKLGSDVLEHSNSPFCPSGCNEPKEFACAPASQTVDVDEEAQLTVSGGTAGGYEWTAEDGDPDSGTGEEFEVSFSEDGTYEVTVTDTDGAEVAEPCRVVVGDGGGEPFCGDGTCQSSESCSSCDEDCGVCATDTPPPVTVTITPTPGGTGTGGTGGTGTGGTGGTGTGGQVGGAGTVPTGPGDVTVVALLASALVTLLYVTHTHSRSYRKREAKKLGTKREPLDFQN